MMRFLQAVILVIFLAILGIFVFQNTHSVTLRFLDWSVVAPVAVLALGVYLLGMVSGWTVVSFLTRSIREVSEPRHRVG